MTYDRSDACEAAPASAAWLEPLADAVAGRLVAASAPTPIAAHVAGPSDTDEPGLWEVCLFYGATEVVGGPADGARTPTAFWFDLTGLARPFDRVDRCWWQSAPLGPDDDFGPHVAVEGEYDGRRVRVRVLAASPAGLPPARTVDRGGAAVERW